MLGARGDYILSASDDLIHEGNNDALHPLHASANSVLQRHGTAQRLMLRHLQAMNFPLQIQDFVLGFFMELLPRDGQSRIQNLCWVYDSC